MILYNNSENVNIYQVKSMLEKALERYPVLHTQPFDYQGGSDDAFVLTRLASGRYSLKPNISQQGLLFRGDHTVLKSGKYSSASKMVMDKPTKETIHAEWLKMNVRRADFELLIESFPLYRMLKDGVAMPNGKTIRIENPFGLAHAYGYESPFLSLTSSLDVAMFYAVAYYDEVERVFKPKAEGKGILYAFEMRVPFGMMPGLSTLGQQVFIRPGRNREFLIQLRESSDFNRLPFVYGFEFTHDRDISIEIMNKFEQGNYLMPHDDVLAQKIAGFDKNVVSEEGFLRNLSGNPNDDEKVNRTILEEAGIHIDNNFNPRFTKEELQLIYEDVNSYWNTFCSHIEMPNDKEGRQMQFFKKLYDNEAYARFFCLNTAMP